MLDIVGDKRYSFVSGVPEQIREKEDDREPLFHVRFTLCTLLIYYRKNQRLTLVPNGELDLKLYTLHSLLNLTRGGISAFQGQKKRKRKRWLTNIKTLCRHCLTGVTCMSKSTSNMRSLFFAIHHPEMIWEDAQKKFSQAKRPKKVYSFILWEQSESSRDHKMIF